MADMTEEQRVSPGEETFTSGHPKFHLSKRPG